MKPAGRFVIKECGLITAILFLLLINSAFVHREKTVYSHTGTLVVTFIIFLIMLICAFNVVKHADRLAEIFGEPYGTLILTLAVISIEVSLIITMMLTGKSDAKLARDTMFAVIMIAVNGFAGLSLLVGGIKHNRQMYNVEGASAYLAVLISLATFCLILPNFTLSTAVGTLSTGQSVLLILVCSILYLSFLIKQTMTHRDYFQFSPRYDENIKKQASSIHSVYYHILLLIIGMIVIITLSKTLAFFLEQSIETAGLPVKLGGFVIALLVLMPEGFSAIQAAYNNQLQRSINLCMGSGVATICLTVPAVLIISLMLRHTLVLGLTPTAMVILILTFFISLITFSVRRTSVLNGMVLLSIFLVYFILIFDQPTSLS